MTTIYGMETSADAVRRVEGGEVQTESLLEHVQSAARICLLCRGKEHAVVFTEFGTDILRCRGCGHIFSSHIADPHDDGFWGDEVVTPDPYWSVARRPMYEDFRRQFVEGCSGSLLDMGCGLGFFVESIARCQGWNAYGCEISPAAVRHARDKLGLSNILCSPLDEVDLPPSSFDVITLWDVLDHLPEPDGMLQKCHSLLKEGGICFIRTPNIKTQLLRARANKLLRGMRPGVTYLEATGHAHHYSATTSRVLLQRNGFKETKFAHFRPVLARPEASVFQRHAKTAGYYVVLAISAISGGLLDLDNLYIIAHKGRAAKRNRTPN